MSQYEFLGKTKAENYNEEFIYYIFGEKNKSIIKKRNILKNC